MPSSATSLLAARLSASARLHAHRSATVACRRPLAPLLTASSAASSPHAALRLSQRMAKSRSLSPDDPFGERSSWEDPSDGLYSAWKDVDLEGFAAAANSEEVRQAHFGPEWARFATVGRLSVKKMNENRTQAASGASPASKAERPSAELANERELQHKQSLMSRNYTSYEAYLAAEYGDDSAEAGATGATGTAPSTGGASAVAAGVGAEEAYGTASPNSAMYTSAVLEASFFVHVDGHDATDRMTQRNPHRDALNTAEAAEIDEEMPLPDFMHQGSGTRAPAAAPLAAVSPAADPPSQTVAAPSAGLADAGAASATTVEMPEAFVQQALDVLGPQHGDAAIPLSDPIEWDTDTILTFLRLFEQRAADDSASVMDETMCDAFVMANVDGKVLLDVVVPPRLFRSLRRWHTRRRDAVVRAHRSFLHDATSEAWRTVLTESLPKLAEAVAPIDAILIQETILLCFPYGGGGSSGGAHN